MTGRRLIPATSALALFCAAAVLQGCGAQPVEPEVAVSQPIPSPPKAKEALAAPPTLAELQSPPTGTEGKPEETRLRANSLTDAAKSYGMRGGLAWRAGEINKQLEGRGFELDRTFAFQNIVLSVPGGSGVVVPPVVTDADDALSVAEDGLSASAAQKVYRILEPGKISSLAPTWRSYLLRSWPAPELPDMLLLPKDDEERKAWREWVAEGWRLGVEQADEIFETDTARLLRDFRGIVLYRTLVAEGVISELFLAEANMGVTGGGDEMRVGDRIVRITSPASLNRATTTWRAYSHR